MSGGPEQTEAAEARGAKARAERERLAARDEADRRRWAESAVAMQADYRESVEAREAERAASVAAIESDRGLAAATLAGRTRTLAAVPPEPDGLTDEERRVVQAEARRLQREGRRAWMAGRRVAIHARVLKKMTPDTVGEIADALISAAKEGDVRAAKELFDRTMGRGDGTQAATPPPVSVTVNQAIVMDDRARELANELERRLSQVAISPDTH